MQKITGLMVKTLTVKLYEDEKYEVARTLWMLFAERIGNLVMSHVV